MAKLAIIWRWSQPNLTMESWSNVIVIVIALSGAGAYPSVRPSFHRLSVTTFLILPSHHRIFLISGTKWRKVTKPDFKSVDPK